MKKSFCDICEKLMDGCANYAGEGVVNEQPIINGKNSKKVGITISTTDVDDLCGQCFSQLVGMFDERPKAAHA